MEPCMYSEGFGLIQCPSKTRTSQCIYVELCMYSEGFGFIQCPPYRTSQCIELCMYIVKALDSYNVHHTGLASAYRTLHVYSEGFGFMQCHT